jgi:predicted DNA-binding transcriptional regulator AlpA
MERPTCKTCLYWDHVCDPDDDSRPVGICHRSPPRYTGTMTSGDSSKSVSLDAWDQPWIAESGWCGEHPDFPAYLAFLRSGRVLGQVELNGDLPRVERSVRIPEVLAFLNCKRPSLYARLNHGDMPYSKHNGSYRLNLAEVEAATKAWNRRGGSLHYNRNGVPPDEAWLRAVNDHWFGWTVTADGQVVKAITVATSGVPA